MTDLNGVYAAISEAADSCLPASAAPAFSLSFSANGNLAATGYIDYVDFLARARLVYRDRQLFISDSRSAGESAVTRFTVEGSSSLHCLGRNRPLCSQGNTKPHLHLEIPFSP
ncbi:MAG: hypothetical protein MZV63_35455 [Marinilabiliales bacterium]|nr:hypothetical protein [Marinilabiliales bacterium]